MFISGMFSLITSAWAQGIGGPPSVGLPGEGGGTEALPNLIRDVINVSLTLVGILALVFFIYGGFTYITSAGDEKQIARGKQIMIYAVLGMIAIGISYAVIAFVIGAFQSGS